MPVLLLTGFEPFGGEKTNPSLEAVKKFSGYTLGDWRVETLELPVAWEHVATVLDEALTRHRPQAIVAVGQAGGRAQLALERVALNICFGKDNYEITRSGEAVFPEGPAAYFSTLPVDAIASTLNSVGIPAYVSLSAGPYLCNFALYTLLHLIKTKQLPTQATFIHIPYLPEQVAGKGKPDLPSMALDTVVAGLRVVVGEIVKDDSAKEGASL